MSLRTDVLADVASFMDDEGEAVTITTRSGPVSITGWWRDRGWDGDQPLGPNFVLAVNDEPDDLETRDTLTRSGDPDVYTVVHINRTAAGMVQLVLMANH